MFCFLVFLCAQPEALQRFIECTTAYEVLSDVDLRKKYDVRFKIENSVPLNYADHQDTSYQWAIMRATEVCLFEFEMVSTHAVCFAVSRLPRNKYISMRRFTDTLFQHVLIPSRYSALSLSVDSFLNLNPSSF